MDKLLVVLVVVCSFFSATAQKGPYRYLKIIHGQNGESWVDVYKRPCDRHFSGESLKTLSFRQFIKAEPTLTKSEGFELAFELEDWRDASPTFGSLGNIQIKEEVIRKVIAVFSKRLYQKNPESLTREEFILLWVKVTRSIFFHYNLEAPINFNQRSKDAALLGEMVWRLMPENLSVCDVKVFSLHKPKQMSVNLLLDCGANIMVKVIVIPDLYFKEKISKAMFEKSSKSLLNFGIAECR